MNRLYLLRITEYGGKYHVPCLPAKDGLIETKSSKVCLNSEPDGFFLKQRILLFGFRITISFGNQLIVSDSVGGYSVCLCLALLPCFILLSHLTQFIMLDSSPGPF